MSLGLDDWIYEYCTLYIQTARNYRQYSAIADLHTLRFTLVGKLNTACTFYVTRKGGMLKLFSILQQ
jgi:hypothetical protein